jgi:hypothetical protein
MTNYDVITKIMNLQLKDSFFIRLLGVVDKLFIYIPQSPDEKPVF